MAERNCNQIAFWESMKEKYEKRNENLRKQETCLRKRLEQLKQLMEKQKAGDDCDCVPEKLEKSGLVQCLVEKGKNLILGSCKCGDEKTGEEFLCACHISDPDVPLNVDPNLCPIEGSSTSMQEGCPNSNCDFYNAQLLSNPCPADPSTFSLKPTDLFYMNELAELVKTEKNMEENIVDLERREHSYLAAINDLRETMKNSPKADPLKNEFLKMTENMEEENKTLRNELKDLRLELKHCFERVEGPLKRSLEDQREKCTKMERQLSDFQTTMSTKEDGYLKEINEIKAKLCNACCTMVDLNKVNSNLKNDFSSLQNRCADLEEELLKQKVKEAENIMKFKNALFNRTERNIEVKNRGDDTQQELGNIARKLSATLKEICPCAKNVPSGLAETAKDIKQLTDFVREKKPKKKTKPKILKSVSCSCSLDKQPKVHPKRTQQVYPCSETSTAEPLPTLTSPNKLKTVASIGCLCCPAQDACEPDVEEQVQETEPDKDLKKSVDTICSCPYQNSQKTGPSEEVIAVKHLGTLSTTPNDMVQNMKKNKLKVNTTCDVINVPPKDVHVVTTIANTGSIEIVTEGPPGIIQTKVNYLPNGKIEIVTKLIDKYNMESFLDGTLLKLSPSAECDESRTCEGQCDKAKDTPADSSTQPNDSFKEGNGSTKPTNDSPEPTNPNDSFKEENGSTKPTNDSPEPTNPNDSFKEENGSIKPTNDSPEPSNPQEEINAMQQNLEENNEQEYHDNDTSAYGNVVINNNLILGELNGVPNPFLSQEWKNENFNEKDLVEHYFRNNQSFAKEDYANDVFELDDNSPTPICLSRKKSLTYVDQYFQDNFGIFSSESSRSLPYPETLETISEGNEEEPINDQISVGSSEETESKGSQEIEISGNCLTNESSSSTSMILKKRSSEETKFSYGNIDEDSVEKQLVSEKNSLAVVPYTSLNDVRSENFSNVETGCTSSEFCDVNEAGISQVSIENALKQADSAFLEWSGSFENISAIANNNKIQLKQSKSLYEGNGTYIESLRSCKSSILELGHLKISFESLKLSSEFAYVGDYGEPRDYTKIAIDDILGNATRNYAVIEKFNGVSMPQQTFQCFVCSCSNTDDHKENEEDQASDRTLQQRIDFLLGLDPLVPQHGPYCNCIDCLYNNITPQSATLSGECQNKMKKLEVNEAPIKSKCGIKMTIMKTPDLPMKQSNDFQHDEDCTCVDCICNPCNFKKEPYCDNKNDTKEYGARFISKNIYDMELFELPKPPEITVMSMRTSCDCNDPCSCNPCMDTNKRSTKTTTPATAPPTNPESWKNVVGGCSCKPQVEESKEVCTCKVCECRPCKYGKRTARACDCAPPKKGEESSQGEEKLADKARSVPPSGKVCECKKCECSFCSDPEARAKAEPKQNSQIEAEPKQNSQIEAEKVQKTPKEHEIEPQNQKSQEECRCVECQCNPCKILQKEAVQKEIIIVKTVPLLYSSNIPPNCDCGSKCSCNPCGKKTTEIGDRISSSPNPCDCEKCECLVCYGKVSDIMNENAIAELIKLSEKKASPITFDKVVPCDCKDCQCDTCPDESVKPKTPPQQKREDSKEVPSEVLKIEEDDSCTCSENEPFAIGDAERAKQEIQNVLSKIGCTCDHVENEFKPLLKKASSFEATISKMLLKLNNLQEKCKDKDQIINAMTKELGARSRSGVFSNLLNELSHPKDLRVPDFTRTLVCDYLPRPKLLPCGMFQPRRNTVVCRPRNHHQLEPILEVDRFIPNPNDIQCYPCRNRGVAGLEITDIRRVTLDSILIKWQNPNYMSEITGYQIFINDELKYRVLSPNRTTAVIDSVDLSSSLEIMLFAMTNFGRCDPPALATYKI